MTSLDRPRLTSDLVVQGWLAALCLTLHTTHTQRGCRPVGERQACPSELWKLVLCHPSRRHPTVSLLWGTLGSWEKSESFLNTFS